MTVEKSRLIYEPNALSKYNVFSIESMCAYLNHLFLMINFKKMTAVSHSDGEQISNCH